MFNHSGKNYLLTFKNNFRRRALAIDFSKFSSVMKSEEEVLSYHADLPIHYEKKIFRNNPRYEFFQNFFFPKSFNHPKFTKKTSIWASKSLNSKIYEWHRGVCQSRWVCDKALKVIETNSHLIISEESRELIESYVEDRVPRTVGKSKRSMDPILKRSQIGV